MKVSHLLIILLCIIIFLGCGGGGGGSGVGPELVSGQISGQILFDDNLANERAAIASYSALRASSFDNILVFLEEMPTRAVYADADGKYSFTDLPLDSSFHIIARIKSLSGSDYKTRTEEIYLGKGNAFATQNIKIGSKDEAKYQIRLQIKDTKDNSVSRCKIWLWGEEFTLDESGSYLSPKMPLGAAGILKVIPPSNKDLLSLEWKIDSNTFQSEIQGVSAVTLPPSGITQKKAPYVSIKVGETLSGGFALRLYGNAVDPQNDSLELEWSTSVGSFTYESVDKSYVDWAIPTEQTTAVVTLKATQVSSTNYPLFWSKVDLPITVSKSGEISYPGEIVVKPVVRTIDIVSSATAQINGDTVSSFDVNASFPNDLELVYTWEVSDGSIVSGKNSRRMYWKAPSLNEKETKVATITAYVSDDIATISKVINVNITSFPVITFTSPVDTEFYPGQLSFRANAKDYLGNFISYEDFKWYLASFSGDLELMQVEGASFTYNFVSQGSYTVCLTAKDTSGVVGTGSIVISILNNPPYITILSPENDVGYTSKEDLAFRVTVTDYEDGEITAPEQIRWYSDIDGLIGSGTSFINNSLTRVKKHNISVQAVDSQGAVSTSSIIIWYDMPARITLTPDQKAVFFEGSKIDFYAKGIDANGMSLASSTYKWYLDGAASPWKTGIERFSANDLSTGIHTVRVIGANEHGPVDSGNYSFEVGWPLPNIISPASGTTFDPGTLISFNAVPTATGTLKFSWYIDEETDSSASNNRLLKELSVGRHNIRYQAIDAGGLLASSTIRVVVEREPQISLNYASGSLFFANNSISFLADCKDSLNNSISDENIKWYFLESGTPVLWKTGSFFNAVQGSDEGQLASGSHTVRVVAKGPYGTVASKSFGFESGIDLLSIISPITDKTYDVGESIEFKANIEKESMPVRWYIDGSLVYTGSSAFYQSFNEGIHYIRAIASDSANLTSAANVAIGVGVYPIIEFYVKNIDGEKINPENTAIFTGKQLVFVGTGTSPIDGSLIDGSLMTWEFCDEEGNVVKQSYNGYSEINVTKEKISEFSPGTGTVKLKCKISDGFAGTKAKQMYFNLPLPSFEFPASNTYITFDDYESESTITTASGYPASVNSVDYEWYLDWGKPGCTKLSDADPSQDGMQLRLNKGYNYLSLVATDSVGQTCAITKKILVDNPPKLSFSPPLDYSISPAYIFNGSNITLRASGTVAIGTEDLRNYKWYLGSDVNAKGTDIEISNIDLGLSKGENIVKLTAEDQFGVSSSVQHSIFFGEALPVILSPAADSVFQNTDIEVTATGSEHIQMQWVLNGYPLEETSNHITISKDNSHLKDGNNTIIYCGTDSVEIGKSSELSFKFARSTSLPAIEMNLANEKPLDNAKLFRIGPGESITIVGSATGVVLHETLGPSRMTWILKKQGSEETKVFTEKLSIALTSEELYATGFWELSLIATDSMGFENSITNTFYYGYPTPVISSPTNHRNYTGEEGEVLKLIGNYSESDSLTIKWFVDDKAPQTGNNIPNPFARGYHSIAYIGTDTAGIVKKDSAEIIVNDNPQVGIKYKKNDGNYYALANNSVFFEGFSMELKGSAKKSDNSEVPDMNTSWFKCSSETDVGTEIVNGNKSPVLSDSALGNGSWYLKFKAEDRDFSSYDFAQSYSASEIVKITTAVPIPKFIGAVDGKRVNEDAIVTFVVNNISPIQGTWNVDNLASHTITELSGDNMQFTFDVSTLAPSPKDRRGYHTIHYAATDSSGKTYSVQTTILVDTGPKFASGYPRVEPGYQSFGTGKMNNQDYTIIKAESNNIKNLNLKVVTNDDAENTIAWHSLSGNHDTNLSDFSRNYSIGSYTYDVTITDNYGIATTSRVAFWVWGYAEYAFTAPTSIISNGSSNLFFVSNNNIVQVNRDTDSTSSTSGKIQASSTASVGADNTIAGLCFYNSAVYSLSGPTSGGTTLTIQKWTTNDLTTKEEDNKNIICAKALNTGSFLMKGTKIYASNRTSSTNPIKLYYLNDGSAYIDSSYIFKKPYDICDSNNYIFVSDDTDNKIVVLDLDGNDLEHGISATSPTGITYSSNSNKLYVAGKNGGNSCVYVIDMNSYKVLYSFSVSGSNDLAICGTGDSSDLYVTDKTNGKIHRFRSGYTW